MTGPIAGNRDIESLKTAGRWPGADRATLVTLATRLAAAGADAQGWRYFSDLASAQRAIEEILEQGEGPRGVGRDAHFGQFVSILDEYQRQLAVSGAAAPAGDHGSAGGRAPAPGTAPATDGR